MSTVAALGPIEAAVQFIDALRRSQIRIEAVCARR
jgi:hypothetical protein